MNKTSAFSTYFADSHGPVRHSNSMDGMLDMKSGNDLHILPHHFSHDVKDSALSFLTLMKPMRRGIRLPCDFSIITHIFIDIAMITMFVLLGLSNCDDGFNLIEQQQGISVVENPHTKQIEININQHTGVQSVQVEEIQVVSFQSEEALSKMLRGSLWFGVAYGVAIHIAYLLFVGALNLFEVTSDMILDIVLVPVGVSSYKIHNVMKAVCEFIWLLPIIYTLLSSCCGNGSGSAHLTAGNESMIYVPVEAATVNGNEFSVGLVGEQSKLEKWGIALFWAVLGGITLASSCMDGDRYSRICDSTFSRFYFDC